MRMLPFDGRFTRPHEVAKTRIQAIDAALHGLYSRLHHLARRRAAHADVERSFVSFVFFVASRYRVALRRSSTNTGIPMSTIRNPGHVVAGRYTSSTSMMTAAPTMYAAGNTG